MSEEDILFRLSQLIDELQGIKQELESYIKNKKESKQSKIRPASQKQIKFLKDLRDKTNAKLSDEEIERMDSKTASQWIDKLLKQSEKNK